MKADILFKGCTRPAMFMGVPTMPFFLVIGGIFLLSLYTNMFMLLLVIPAFAIMRAMAKRDEMIFHLLGLRLKFKFKAKLSKDFPGMWVFTPNDYRKDTPKMPPAYREWQEGLLRKSQK